jgi:AraC-like DNA-binding protein
MSEEAILERFDRMERLISRLLGERLTREEMCERFGISSNTLRDRVATGEAPQPFMDGKWMLYRVLEWEHEREAARVRFTIRPKAHHLYRHFDESGKLLYVGISLHAVSRLAAHKRTSPWVWSVARMEVQTYPTRLEAEIAEREAIKAERPLFNSMHGDRALRAQSLRQL